jgi:hypothetical protein
MRYVMAVILMAVFSYGEGNTSAPLELKEPKEVKQKPDFIYTRKGWKLKIWYTAKGSRSEGIFGKLYHNGKEVHPKMKNEELLTPLGKLHFITTDLPWGAHGWIFDEGERVVPPSWEEK